MKLFSFQCRDDGERFDDAAIVLWRIVDVYDGTPVTRAFGINVMLPIPIFGKYWDVPMDALMRGWRLPRVLIYCRQSAGGKHIAFRRWMHPVGRHHLLAYRWQIEDGIYPPKEGAN